MSSSFAQSALLASFILFFSCSPKTEQATDASSPDSTTVAYEAEETEVTGDFDGDGTQEKVLTRTLINNSEEDDYQYAIEFSNPKLPPIKVSPMVADGYMVLSEGNIDGGPGHEISYILTDVNNTGTLYIHSFTGKEWIQIAQPVNVDCTVPYKIDPEAVVTKTDSGVYAVDYAQFDSIVFQRKLVVFVSAIGDFDGDGNSENVYLKTIHDAALDDSGTWEYWIEFSNDKLPTLKIENPLAGGCYVQNDGKKNGKKNGKPGDVLTVSLTQPMNQMSFDTYRFDGKEWKVEASGVNSRE
jgi:hypothetical protein